MPEAQPKRLLVVDDHAIVREGLKLILSDAPDIVVAGEADNASHALHLIREQAWDLVLLDISLPDRNGLEALELIHKEFPALKVLVLSMHRESQYAVRAIRGGAVGYLNKQGAPRELLQAVQQVLAGKKYITTEVADMLASEVSGNHEGRPHETLSNREFETLRLLASGQTVSQIAENLRLSVKTVSMYRSRLLEKMSMKNNAELTHYAIRHGLTE